jgi:hypothetical protein
MSKLFLKFINDMWKLNLIFFFIHSMLGVCFQVDYQAFFPSKFITQNKSKYFLSLNLDDHLQQAKKKFAPKKNFVNLNKFSELDASQAFVNHSCFNLLFQDEFQKSIEYQDFEFFYGLNPWDKKFFQRLKTNFGVWSADVEFLIGIEEACSLLNYLSGLSFIVDLEIIF